MIKDKQPVSVVVHIDLIFLEDNSKSGHLNIGSANDVLSLPRHDISCSRSLPTCPTCWNVQSTDVRYTSLFLKYVTRVIMSCFSSFWAGLEGPSCFTLFESPIKFLKHLMRSSDLPFVETSEHELRL